MLDYLRFSEVKVLCIGDVMLDCFISGDVGRISPEGPVPVMCARSEEYFAGGAANVARNISSLGASCTLLGAVGKDNNGSKLLDLLNAVDDVSARFVELINARQRSRHVSWDMVSKCCASILRTLPDLKGRGGPGYFQCGFHDRIAQRCHFV